MNLTFVVKTSSLPYNEPTEIITFPWLDTGMGLSPASALGTRSGSHLPLTHICKHCDPFWASLTDLFFFFNQYIIIDKQARGRPGDKFPFHPPGIVCEIDKQRLSTRETCLSATVYHTE